jgi:hypothetical protein
VTPRAFAEHYIQTEMTRDPEAVAAMYAEHGELVTADHVVVGRPALLAFYRKFLAPMTRVSLRLGRVVGDSTTIAFEWIGDSDVAGRGRVLSAGTDFLSVREGLVLKNSVYIQSVKDA